VVDARVEAREFVDALLIETRRGLPGLVASAYAATPDPGFKESRAAADAKAFGRGDVGVLGARENSSFIILGDALTL